MNDWTDRDEIGTNRFGVAELWGVAEVSGRLVHFFKNMTLETIRLKGPTAIFTFLKYENWIFHVRAMIEKRERCFLLVHHSLLYQEGNSLNFGQFDQHFTGNWYNLHKSDQPLSNFPETSSLIQKNLSG